VVEVLLVLALAALSSFLGWCLGVRRERGRHHRLEEIRELEKETVRRRGGVKLHSIKLRR
jgi:hypothetical protein